VHFASRNTISWRTGTKGKLKARFAAGSKQRDGEKRIDGPPPQPTLPAVRQAILELIAQPLKQRCPHCQKWICNKQRRE
jgi:hypothetical protein